MGVIMDRLNAKFFNKPTYPVKIVQFGEGNFLRGFVDWMVHKSNKENHFNGSIRVIQPINSGMVDVLNEQNGLYTLISRGIQNGKLIQNKEIITSIEKGVNPYTDFDTFLKTAELPELRFVISNTTEAGIAYTSGESINDKPQQSYPGKLTSFLYKRYKHFSGDVKKGLIIIPCELIDRNGDTLKNIVYRLAQEWNMEKNFIEWLDKGCDFLNSLVDRIVTGYPGDEIESLAKELNYDDRLIDTSELFNLWVIEGDSKYAREFPLHESGCNVVWTDDMTPFRTRKVRILNGIHTMICMTAYLYGIDTVGNCLKDEYIRKFIDKGLYEEIIPAVDFDKNELISFAEDVIERFENPFIEHHLINISLNSVSKFKARVLPTVLEYVEQFNKAPEVLTCSLAALLHFYGGLKENGDLIPVKDDKDILDKFNDFWDQLRGNRVSDTEFVTIILSDKTMWGQDLSLNQHIYDSVLKYFNAIKHSGISKTIRGLF